MSIIVPNCLKSEINDTLKSVRKLANNYKNQINLSNGKTTFDPVMNGLAKTSFPETLPFAFWEIEDDDAFEFFITELSENMEMSDLDDSDFLELPLGYAICRYLLSFEFSCASEGWTAFANIDEQDLMLVLDFYEKVGLKDESLAINTAYKAWIIAVDLDEDSNDTASKAYNSVKNEYSDDDLRWAYLLRILRNSSFWLSNT